MTQELRERSALRAKAGSVLTALAAFAVCHVATGQDLVAVAPELAKVEYEDAGVRVVRLRIPEGAAVPMHDRPRRVVVSLTANDVLLTRADGTTSVTRTEAGTVAWSEPAVRGVQNRGAPLENVVVELKRADDVARASKAPSPRPADYLDDPLHVWTFENQYVRVYDVRIPPGKTTTFHRHAYDQVTVYVSGGRVATQIEGQPWGRTSAIAARSIAVEPRASAPLTHRVRNDGTAEYHTILVQFLSPTATTPAAPTTRRPIIDMHLHASSPDALGGPQTICTNRDRIEFPPIDPRETATVQKAATCAHPLMSARDADDNARRTGEIMQRYDLRGVLAVGTDPRGLQASLARGDAWQRHAAGRYWLAVDFSDATPPPLDELEALVRSGRIRLFAEISPQYDGEALNVARLEPYFALAERLDVPVGVHLGEGPPGGAHVSPGSRYSPAAGRPFDLEPVLQRHPKLRLYVMHYGSPLVEEMIAMLYAHPNLYVDVAQNDWGFPREHFLRQLRQLVDAGFSKRIMFGSDQMIWPEAIPIAIDTIEQAPFLSEEQKSDIFYGNAARFLRLSEAEMAAHRRR